MKFNLKMKRKLSRFYFPKASTVREKRSFIFITEIFNCFFFPLLAPTTLPVQYLTVYLSHAVCRHVFGSVFRIQIRTDPHKEMHASWIRIRIRIRFIRWKQNCKNKVRFL